MKNFILRYPLQLSAAWAALILLLCAMPGKYVPYAGWMDLLALDKFVHASLFFVLTVLILLSALRSLISRRAIGALVFLVICYGILLEIMQAAFFSERTMDVLDVLANTAGVLIALLFYGRLRRFCETRSI